MTTLQKKNIISSKNIILNSKRRSFLLINIIQYLYKKYYLVYVLYNLNKFSVGLLNINSLVS